MATTATPTETENAALARAAFDALNRRDLDFVSQLWTEATVERFPDRTCHGADEIRAYFEDVFTALPDWHMDVVAMAAQGDDVLVHWHLTATHEGPLLGIAPTGKQIAIDGMDHFVFRDGKVASNFVIADQMQYARQIGMMPADRSLGDRALKSLFNVRSRVTQALSR